MASPVPGKQYTVKEGDTLSGIANIAYGQAEKFTVIFDANQTVLKSSDPNLIFPGEVILIPELTELKESTNRDLESRFLNDPDNKTRLIINEIEIPTQETIITRTMDTAADGWTASIAWNPGADEALDNATRPYGYQTASVYIGGVLKVHGALYGVKPTLSNNGRGKELEGWSLTADMIDSTIKPPYEVNDLTLRQRAEELMKPFSINVKWDIDDDLKFDKITAVPSESVFSHLLKYAKQRGVLISSSPVGELQFLRANVNGKSIGTIEEGKRFVMEYTANFDGRKRFNSYKAIGQSPKSSNKFEVVKDDAVPKTRMVTFNNPDSTEGNLKSAAEWKRSSQLAEALTIPFKATSWYGPDGKQWTENQIVTVRSPVISINDGFDFLIKRVSYRKENSGRTTDLNLVPPQVYSGEPIPDIFK